MLRPVLACSLLVAVAAAPVRAQDSLATPQLSPHAQLTQTVGMTEIVVDYHAPAVRGREIFGDKVPYGVVWRAGANANTIITFEHDVIVEGQKLPAGAYGLHMLPGQDAWEVIFNHESEAWGSYSYDEYKDALRVTVTPQDASHRERLTYLFDDVGDEAATLVLHWSTTAVPVRIDSNVAEVVLGPVRDAADRNSTEPGWQFWVQAAEFGRGHGVGAEERLDWIDRSVAAQRTFSNLWARSEALGELDRREEAGKVREEALALVNLPELQNLGYAYVLRDDHENAVRIFEMVAGMNSPNWWPYTQLAQSREKLGDHEGAAEAWRQALTKNPDPVTQGEIEAHLKALGAG